jgi:type II secretory pathway pseudopilin PulG
MSRTPPRRRGFTPVELLVLLGIIAIILGLGAIGLQHVRFQEGRSQSINNLKQLAIAVHGIASRAEGRLPPSVGTFLRADRLNASIFFHLIPDMSANSGVSQYRNDFDAIEADGFTFPQFSAPLDPTNPGRRTTSISYASNAAVFGQTDEGTTRFPGDFMRHSTASTVLFMERYAVVGPAGTRHTWHGRGELDNYLYPPSDKSPDPPDDAVPQLGVAPDDASNTAPHGFRRSTMYIALGDGSTRTITRAATRTFVYGEDRTATIWAWACSLHGDLGQATMPDGW